MLTAVFCYSTEIYQDTLTAKPIQYKGVNGAFIDQRAIGYINSAIYEAESYKTLCDSLFGKIRTLNEDYKKLSRVSADRKFIISLLNKDVDTLQNSNLKLERKLKFKNILNKTLIVLGLFILFL
jgi:hypothetical protein